MHHHKNASPPYNMQISYVQQTQSCFATSFEKWLPELHALDNHFFADIFFLMGGGGGI